MSSNQKVDPHRRYHRPSGFERPFSRALTSLNRIGLIRSHFYVLDCGDGAPAGIISMPVGPLDLGVVLLCLSRIGAATFNDIGHGVFAQPYFTPDQAIAASLCDERYYFRREPVGLRPVVWLWAGARPTWPSRQARWPIPGIIHCPLTTRRRRQWMY